MSHNDYLTVGEALDRVLAGVQVLPAVTTPLLAALGQVLAEPIIAQDNLPPFANSAMDGYAVRAADLVQASHSRPVPLQVVADIAAGSVPDVVLQEGTTARIMTGAPLPAGADAVIPVEETNEAWRNPERPLPKAVEVYRPVQSGDYVRWPGEDMRAGSLVIPAGQLVRPQEIAVLAALGLAQVAVIRRPRVGVLATGDELIEIGEALRPGKIRNSNSYAQTAQLLSLGAIPVPLGIARDQEADVTARLQEGLAAGVDLFISSAGVSVGAYDVVKAVLERAGAIAFWRVRMRPGKPLAFGQYGGVPYLGLPGNPVSAMLSFERFGRPLILKMAGHRRLSRPERSVEMQEEIYSDGRESYLRAIISCGQDGRYQALTTGKQDSHLQTSLVRANGLVIVPEGVKYVPAGDHLTALMTDWPEIVF